MSSRCCGSPTYVDRIDGGLYCEVCDQRQGCQWFALCDNAATHTQPHPILGDVPICDRCQANYDAAERPR